METGYIVDLLFFDCTQQSATHWQVEQLQLMALRREDGSCVGAGSKHHMGTGSISPKLHGPQGWSDLLSLALPVLVAPDHSMRILHFQSYSHSKAQVEACNVVDTGNSS